MAIINFLLFLIIRLIYLFSEKKECLNFEYLKVESEIPPCYIKNISNQINLRSILFVVVLSPSVDEEERQTAAYTPTRPEIRAIIHSQLCSVMVFGVVNMWKK